ncbi:cobyric acid synthase [uncultured Desulfovibrio sp.]|uniref:cobyric acid synthase n=1 Tax=uncultured Desulfovibrio sp. TaxID=167968 RepID=UPI002206BEF2|nr:cobyric acid synthase [uncultured Desulfovibrio sp.]CAI3238335.1 Cobyric acid synthase (EC [Desulfovibrio diazotrophicus]
MPQRRFFSPGRAGLPPALMFQGTCSNAGKSLLTAGLCRLLARQGLRVAPFKAQNMSLNSFVTAEGGEMGRAQVLQALACGLAPDVRMNPVLLKPTSQIGSQVLVLGRPVGQMRVAQYLEYKPRAWRAVCRAYRELAADRDVLVLEGAGSPAEINLRAHDIVNMRMARYAGARVALVADIDRGGAFAALAGTLALLTRADRARVAGLILNKFRGDASLLTPALTAISRRTGKPFWGVVPMLEDLRLPEEDSVSFKAGLTPGLHAGAGGEAAGGLLDVLVVDLPHISNATDLDALRNEPGVRLRVARRTEDWGAPEVVLLPGSRNTAADARFLRAGGLAASVVAFAARCLRTGRGALVGVCGGLQLLGAEILDPLALEEGGREAGLNLLPLRTTLQAAKQLRRTTGTALAALTDGEADAAVTGYEIHHGSTEVVTRVARLPAAGEPTVLLRDAAGAALGWGLCDAAGRARVWGSYLHGLFDADVFRHAFLAARRAEAGLPPAPQAAYDLGPELDRLADCLEAALDLPAVYAQLRL